MKTRLTVFFVSAMFFWAPAGHTQMVYTEAAPASGIQHFYGNGAPGGGVSFYDFNQDGTDDITLGGIAGEGISFYVNQGGNFTLINPLVDVPFEIKQILWVDFDNDRDKDLYVACFDGHNMLFENKGGLVMEDITETAGLPTELHRGFGALWADFNRDSWPDLYFVRRRTGADTTLNENRLFLNHPHGLFEEVTDAAGVADRGKKPFCAVAIDYDNDKWPDIYINNDKQTINTLLHNAGDGTFEDVSVQSMANFQMDAMGTAMGDYDNDGWLDMYVSNIPAGNVLLHNNGPDNNGVFTFTDLAEASNTALHGVAWGTNFLDGDNDGDLDLYVNSMLSGAEQINSTLYENLGDGSFRNMEGELYGDTCVSFSNAVGDANLDGLPDIMVVNQGDFRSQLWLSQVPFIPNHYVKITLEGVVSNKDAIGTRIEAFAGGEYQMRYTHCGISFLGQNSGTEILGLRDHATIDSLRITWPTGHVDILKDVTVNQTLHIIEGSTTNGIIHIDPDITIISSDDALAVPSDAASLNVYPNPASDRLMIDFDHPGIYTIMRLDGQTVLHGTWTPGRSAGIDIQGLGKGMYVMAITSDHIRQAVRWIKI